MRCRSLTTASTRPPIRRSGPRTASSASFPVPIAGKTGTAEKLVTLPGYPPPEPVVVVRLRADGQPEIVVCAVIENGGHGGDAAAPAALQVFRRPSKKVPRQHSDNLPRPQSDLSDPLPMLVSTLDSTTIGARALAWCSRPEARRANEHRSSTPPVGTAPAASPKRSARLGSYAGSTGSCCLLFLRSLATGSWRSTDHPARNRATEPCSVASPVYAVSGLAALRSIVDRSGGLPPPPTLDLRRLSWRDGVRARRGRGDPWLAPLDRHRLLPLPALGVRQGALRPLPGGLPGRVREADRRGLGAPACDRARRRADPARLCPAGYRNCARLRGNSCRYAARRRRSLASPDRRSG